jgi:phosphate transport system substrate-binding protein
MTRIAEIIAAALLGASTVALSGAAPALADPVTLKLSGGGPELHGPLVSFDGKNYVIDAEVIGRTTLAAGDVVCVGKACPQAVAALDKAPPTAASVLNIRGSDTVGTRLMPELVRRYATSIQKEIKQQGEETGDLHIELQEPGGGARYATIEMKRQGSDTAFAALAAREAQIGMSDRPITDLEIGALAKAGFPGMNKPKNEHIIGLDGIVVITSLRNYASSLSLEHLSMIFAGEIQDWSALGLPAGKINLYVPSDKSGTLHTFNTLVMKPYKRSISPDAKRFDASNAELAKQVAADRHGIGLASFAELNVAKGLAIKDACGLVHQPSEFAVKTKEYPLSRGLYLYTTELSNPQVANLIRFAGSAEAQAVLSEIGFIDQRVVALPYDKQSDRIANSLNAAAEDFNMEMMRTLIDDFRNGERLSATLRFEPGSAQLDSESVQSLLRLLQYLENTDIKGQQILLAGFTDTSGPFEQNRQLSLSRAKAVRDALLTASNGSLKPEQIVAKGFSELVPVACNDTEIGRERNRRVEVWLTRPPQIRTKLLIERL